MRNVTHKSSAAWERCVAVLYCEKLFYIVLSVLMDQG